MNEDDYEVVVLTPTTRTLYEVRGWSVRGASLVPRYGPDHMTPQDEHPMNEVFLRMRDLP